MLNITFLGGHFYLINKTPFIKNQIIAKGDTAKSQYQAYFYYLEAYKIAPKDADLLYKMGKILLLIGETKKGLHAVMTAAQSKNLVSELEELVNQLMDEKRQHEAELLRDLILQVYQEN